MVDVIENVPEKTIKCLDKGFVTLIDVMPRLVPDDQKTADYAICQMARVSYGNGTKSINEDYGLIRYLMRHSHTSPFEGVEFKFHMKMPIFVARQAVRHRTACLNETSGRYSVLKDEFYIPQSNELRKQSVSNKQGGSELIEGDLAQKFVSNLKTFSEETYDTYEDYLKEGVSREQARMILPVNLYTEWYWKCDLHNLLHFLALRCDSHAQYEIRVFAEAILKLITLIVPWTVEAWNDYHPMRGAIKLTRLEVEDLKRYITKHYSIGIDSSNKREQQEWKDKKKTLGISPPAGAICPHCGQEGIQGYHKEDCCCPQCGKSISLPSISPKA